MLSNYGFIFIIIKDGLICSWPAEELEMKALLPLELGLTCSLVQFNYSDDSPISDIFTRKAQEARNMFW